MKVVLADPPDVQTPWLIANHPNLGILYLTGYLREKISHVDVSYLNASLTLKGHLNQVQAIKPDLYGLSFSVMREQDAFKAMKAVKEKFPHLPIICGGPYPTVMAEEILKDFPVDVCVRGEGEVTMKELVEVFQGKRNLEDVAGILFRKDGQIIATEKRALIPDLDILPLPAWDLVDFKKYKGNYQYMAKPSTVVIASRGCPYDCVFCANPVWKLSKPWLRLRSPSSIRDEIYSLYRRGIREISIRSDEFNPVLPWTLNVCREIQRLGLKDLFFQGNLRVDKVTDELVREMKESNFWLVQLGIESGNQRTLDGIEKKITLEQVAQTCTRLKKYGIKVYAYIMIYHAWEENGRFCYESPDDVKSTFAFVRRLKKEGLIHYMSFSTTTPMLGSRLYDIACRHRVLKKDGAVNDLSDFYLELPNISRKAMKRSRLEGLLLQSLINFRSGHNCFTDWGKNWHKVKTFLESI